MSRAVKLRPPGYSTTSLNMIAALIAAAVLAWLVALWWTLRRATTTGVSTRAVTWLGVGFFKLLARVLPQDLHAAIVVLFLGTWLFWAGFFYLTPRLGTKAGFTANHAHGHVGAAVATAVLYTLIACACCALALHMRNPDH
jgi:hypothetical protein